MGVEDFNLSPYQGNTGFDAALNSGASSGGSSMPFPVLGAIGAGASLLGNIFGSLSAAKKERDALKREQERKPFQLSSEASQAYRTGYSPKLGQNVFSLMPLMNQRMAAMFGSRYSSIYNPKQFSSGGTERSGESGGSDMRDNLYRELARERMGRER